MAKSKKSKVSLLDKINSWSRAHKILAIILVLAIGYFGYKYTAIYIEKRDLNNKTAQINELADKISALYPPDERTTEQYCQYTNQKFEKGDLSCITSLTLRINDVNAAQANKIRELIETDQKTNFLVGNTSDKTSVMFSDGEDYAEKDFIRAFIIDKDDNCSITIRYLSKNKEQVLRLNCSLESRAEHYPVKN